MFYCGRSGIDTCLVDVTSTILCFASFTRVSWQPPTPGQVDQTFNRMVLDSLQGALPVRVGSMNMCYPPSFFRLVWVVISTFLHE